MLEKHVPFFSNRMMVYILFMLENTERVFGKQPIDAVKRYGSVWRILLWMIRRAL